MPRASGPARSAPCVPRPPQDRSWRCLPPRMGMTWTACSCTAQPSSLEPGMARVPKRHDELRRARSIGFAGIPGGASGRYAPAVTAGDTLLPDMEVAREALGCISALAAGPPVNVVPGLAKPAVIDLVAEAVETAAVPGMTDEHPWARGIAALEDCGHPAIPMLLRARAAEGSGRSDEARQLIESCLRLDPTL